MISKTHVRKSYKVIKKIFELFTTREAKWCMEKEHSFTTLIKKKKKKLNLSSKNEKNGNTTT